MDPLTILLCAVVAWLLYDFVRLNMVRGIPGKIRLPVIGDLHTMVTNWSTLHDFMGHHLIKNEDKPIAVYLGHYLTWGVSRPDDTEHILKTNWKNYPVAQGLRGDALADLLGDGIFHADGDSWFTQRKTVSREFTMNNFKSFMLKEFTKYALQLRKVIVEATKNGEEVELHSLYYRLTLDSFGEVAFGVDLGGLRGVPQPFARAFDDAQEICGHRVGGQAPFMWKTMRALNIGAERRLKEDLKVIDSFVEELVDQRTGETTPRRSEREDLFSRLLQISAKEEDNAKRVKYLRDMAVNFMIAGRDTTACALSWLSWEVSQHPEVESRLLEELHDLLTTEYPSYDDLAGCHYLTAIIHETLRLHPSVPFDVKHVAADDVLPSGVQLKAGDAVAYLPYATGRSPRVWGADATRFKPERWLDAEGNFVRQDPFKFPAFQAGPRLCLGVDMAILEMKSVVATLYRSLTFEALEAPSYLVAIVLQMKKPGLRMRSSIRPNLSDSNAVFD